MTPPLISCLCATHGRLPVIRQAVACFLRQDWPARELVILNNHPTPLECRAPGVRVINEPGHATLGDCRIRLLEEARGEFVRTWDDDDLYLPWSLSQGMAQIGSAAAWKPARSWFTNGGRDYSLAGNAMEASILFRSDVVRQYGYRKSGGDEHAPLLDNLGSRIEQLEVGVWTGYVYRWGMGLHHISGSLGRNNDLSARTSAWKAANNRGSDGRPLDPTPDDFAALDAIWRRIATFCEPDSAEWLACALGEKTCQH